MSDDEKHGPQRSEEHKTANDKQRVEDNKENTSDFKHGLGINLEVKEKEAEHAEDVNLPQSQTNEKEEKVQQMAETEWICENCNSLNFIIYDDSTSCYCNSKCIYDITVSGC